MSTLGCVKLTMTTPLHISRGFSDNYGISEATLHSDSLKSALFAAVYAHLPDQFRNESFFKAFSVSSCFPFSGDTIWMARPRMRVIMDFPVPDDPNVPKRIKKLTWTDLETWKKIISGESITVKNEDQQFDASGRWFSSQGKPRVPFVRALQERVAIPAQGSVEDPDPYSVERLYFSEHCGLCFFFSLHDSAFAPVFYECLNHLSSQGIGTDRSSGNGHFTFRVEEHAIQLPHSNHADAWLALGHYLPASAEELMKINLEESAYALVKRGGFIAGSSDSSFAHLRKKSIYMFSEGSVFKAPDCPKGGLTDLKPDWPGMHPVWRDGAPLFIPVILPPVA